MSGKETTIERNKYNRDRQRERERKTENKLERYYDLTDANEKTTVVKDYSREETKNLVNCTLCVRARMCYINAII